jgi:hypothetical protein
MVAHCQRNALQKPDLEALSELFVDPALDYVCAVYADVLECVRVSTGCTPVFEKIIQLGFQTAAEFSSEDFFDILTQELRNFCGNPMLKVEQQLSVIRMALSCHRASAECDFHERGLHALIDAGFYINQHSTPVKVREEFEVEKAVFLQSLEERHLGGLQLLALLEFYENAPVVPVIPTLSIADLALMSALAAPIKGQVRYPQVFVKLLNGAIPSRTDLIEKLIANARKSVLKNFAVAAELHENVTAICSCFQAFLKEFGNVYRVPRLFAALGVYAGIRIVQAFSIGREWIDLPEVIRAIPWLNEVEVHSAIGYALQKRMIRGRISAALNRLTFF